MQARRGCYDGLEMHCYVDESYVFRLERRQRQDTLFSGRKAGT